VKNEEATKKQLSRLIRRLQERYHRLEDKELRQPDLRGWQVPVILSVLHQVYAISPPVVRLTFLCQKPSLTYSHLLYS
jgi:hypothetical protein